MPDQHVIPEGDLKEHVLSRDCWCRPRLEPGDPDSVVVHNSLDRRELYEAKVA